MQTLQHFVRPFLLLIGLWLHINTMAQDPAFGNWIIYQGNQAFGKGWNFWNEAQYRNVNFIGDAQQYLIRTGIGYNLTENNNNVLLGYAFVHNAEYHGDVIDQNASTEHRIYQQFLTKQTFPHISFQHRYRLEERFIPDNYKWRFRYQLGLNIPVTTFTSGDVVYVSVYDEVFLQPIGNAVFDRNRLYGAMGYKFTPNLKCEFGYMIQTLSNTSRGQLQMSFINTIPFKKQE